MRCWSTSTIRVTDLKLRDSIRTLPTNTPTVTDNVKSFPEKTDAQIGGRRIAIVAARFNQAVVDPLVEGAKRTLVSAGAAAADINVLRVPGAFELPLAAKWLAEQGSVDGIVALGAVIRGETPHFDFVCNEAARGLNNVALAHGLPVGFGVITADSDEQALARAGGAVGNKGEEAALAVIEMLVLHRCLHAGKRP